MRTVSLDISSLRDLTDFGVTLIFYQYSALDGAIALFGSNDFEMLNSFWLG
jgi:hypothetical protein